MTNGSYEKKFQIFVSSTYTDLIEERQKLVEAILHTGNIPAGMELFTASNKDQWQIIKRWINESDIVILLIGSRYGSIPQGDEKSYTHKEYDYAKEQNKIVLPFIMSESHMYGKVSSGSYKLQDIQENINQEKFDRFKDIILNSSVCKLDIQNIDQLKSDVILSIREETIDLEGGWIRVKDIDNLKVSSPTKKDYDLEFYNQIKGDLTNIHEILNEFVVNKTFIKNASIKFLTDFIYRFKSTNTFDTFLDSTLKNLFRDYVNSLTKILLLIDNHKGEEHGNVTIFPNNGTINQEENKDILKSFNDYLVNSFAFEQVLVDKVHKDLFE